MCYDYNLPGLRFCDLALHFFKRHRRDRGILEVASSAPAWFAAASLFCTRLSCDDAFFCLIVHKATVGPA